MEYYTEDQIIDREARDNKQKQDLCTEYEVGYTRLRGMFHEAGLNASCRKITAKIIRQFYTFHGIPPSLWEKWDTKAAQQSQKGMVSTG